jgi:hypothetical protein
MTGPSPLFLAHVPTLLDVVLTIALLVVGPVATTALVWWLDPGRAIRRRRGRTGQRRVGFGVAGYVLNAAITYLYLATGAFGPGHGFGPAGDLSGVLLPGAAVALVTVCALEWLGGR